MKQSIRFSITIGTDHGNIRICSLHCFQHAVEIFPGHSIDSGCDASGFDDVFIVEESRNIIISWDEIGLAFVFAQI